MKKILYFFESFLYVMGVIGGIGYALYSHAYVIAAAVLVLGFMALPTFLYALKKLLDDDSY